jgi:hypothetical protein
MRKKVFITMGLLISALATTSAFGFVAAKKQAANTGTPAVEHVKPAPVAEATPPAIKVIAKRREVMTSGKPIAQTTQPPKSTESTGIGLDMSKSKCVTRPLSSGKPGETVTICE